jgi:hypothetical protein
VQKGTQSEKGSKMKFKQRVFIHLRDINFAKWDLPKEYRAAIEPHVDSNPTFLLLSWPSTILPPEGQLISLTGMVSPFNEVLVLKHDFDFNSELGVTIDITVRADNVHGVDCNLDTLLYASQEGWIFENEVPVQAALQHAGLKAER